jgi:hypothetical protein
LASTDNGTDEPGTEGSRYLGVVDVRRDGRAVGERAAAVERPAAVGDAAGGQRRHFSLPSETMKLISPSLISLLNAVNNACGQPSDEQEQEQMMISSDSAFCSRFLDETKKK